MKIDYKKEDHRSSLVLPDILVALGTAKFGSSEKFKIHAQELASQCPVDQKTTYWVRDSLILEFSQPELIDKLGDSFRQHSLRF